MSVNYEFVARFHTGSNEQNKLFKGLKKLFKTFLFCKSFPLQPFFFFFRTDYMIPQTFTVLNISVFSF